MSVKFSNNGHSTLASSLTSSATSITVASGHGARFPSLTGSEYFYATLIDSSNNLEIVKVTARSSDVLTVTRAQESTTARAYAIGDRVELRVTAQGLVDVGTPAADSIVNSMIATDAVNSDSIAANAVGASELNVSGNGTAGDALLSDGDGSFSYGSAGGINQIKKFHYTTIQSITSTGYTNTSIAVSITPTAADSSFYIHAVISGGMINHDSHAMFNVHDSQLGSSYSTTSQFAFPVTHPLSSQTSINSGYMSNHWSTGADGQVDDYRGANQSHVLGLYTPASNNSNARTFTVVCRTHRDTQANGIRINDQGSLQNNHGHQTAATSYIMVWEVANGIFS